ncbi:MAG TPA: Na/Pi cotransporter family protein [Clostridia bacterium]
MDKFLEILHACVQLLAGMGVFLYGLHTMSNGMEKSAGKSIRKLFNKINDNRFVGLGIGTVATALIQSSTAVSVMLIGFVNAGVMSLYQATAIIMGANIGTTLDAFLIVLQDLDISSYFALLAFVGIIMMMVDKKGNISRIGESLVGVGLIFIGLSFMSDSFSNSAIIKSAIEQMFSVLTNPFLLILISMIITALVHSSSLVTAVIIILVNAGSLSTMSAFYIVLGSNIGTCFTAIIAAIGTSTNSKRTAFIHIFFNVIGVLLFLCFMLPMGKHFENIFITISGGNAGLQVALFHLIFNVVSVIIYIPFIKQIVWCAEKFVPDKKVETAPEKLRYLDERILNSPSVAISQILKEITDMGHLAETNMDLAMSDVINATDINVDTVYKNEKQLNYLNKALTNYLVKISSLNISKADEVLIGSLYHVVSDIERIGDHSENLCEAAQQMVAENISFSEEAKNEIMTMYQKVKLLYRDALYVFDKRDVNMIKEVNRREEEIDNMKKQFSNNHIKRLHSGICSVESGEVFYDLTMNLERIADHLTNIAYSIRERSEK